jgi:hypothetical protein
MPPTARQADRREQTDAWAEGGKESLDAADDSAPRPTAWGVSLIPTHYISATGVAMQGKVKNIQS